MNLWVCKPCAIKAPLTWPDPGDYPPPDCPGCRRPMSLHDACPHCEGTGYVEATQVCPPDDGPCGECRGTGAGPLTLEGDVDDA